MRKMLFVDTTKCTGCESCVDLCSGRKSGVFSEKTSRVRILKNEAGADFIPLLCEHCREHLCVDACPVGAIQYNTEVSVFRVDENACTGCGACEEVCLYKGIFVSDGVAMMCDLCGGHPACIPVCYPKALQYMEVTDEATMADLKHKIEKLGRLRRHRHE